MKNMLHKPLSEKLAEAIAKIAYEIVMILLGLIALVGKGLYSFRRWEWRLIVVGFILYSAYTTFPFFAEAPKAQAAYTHPNNIQVMVIHPNMQVREIVLSLTKIEFGDNQVDSMDKLLMRESGFNPQAINPQSGACGIFQSLPCNKMLSMSIQDQIQFGFDYIKNRYGNPDNAWAHEVKDGWY
jgi:hypothetical protein